MLDGDGVVGDVYDAVEVYVGGVGTGWRRLRGSVGKFGNDDGPVGVEATELLDSAGDVGGDSWVWRGVVLVRDGNT